MNDYGVFVPDVDATEMDMKLLKRLGSLTVKGTLVSQKFEREVCIVLQYAINLTGHSTENEFGWMLSKQSFQDIQTEFKNLGYELPPIGPLDNIDFYLEAQYATDIDELTKEW